MKQRLIFGLIFLTVSAYGQTKISGLAKLQTSKYAGTYDYGGDPNRHRSGSMIVYPETDSTILFYVDLISGPPSYSLGELYGRIRITNDSGTFNANFDSSESGCKWRLKFSKNAVRIKTLDLHYDCHFGHDVYADGVFKRKSRKIPISFDDQSGKTIYFKKVKPKEYN